MKDNKTFLFLLTQYRLEMKLREIIHITRYAITAHTTRRFDLFLHCRNYYLFNCLNIAKLEPSVHF